MFKVWLLKEAELGPEVQGYRVWLTFSALFSLWLLWKQLWWNKQNDFII